MIPIYKQFESKRTPEEARAEVREYVKISTIFPRTKEPIKLAWIKYIESSCVNGWLDVLNIFLERGNGSILLEGLYAIGIVVGDTVPRDPLIFQKTTDIRKVRVVIIGQDPYPTKRVVKNEEGEEREIHMATGYAFAPNHELCDQKLPPSAANIIENIYRTCYPKAKHVPSTNDAHIFDSWPSKGVLLLNSSLTLHEESSERVNVWSAYVRNIVEFLSQRGKVVFMLWGALARGMKDIISANCSARKVLISEASHPVGRGGGDLPFSEYTGFLQANGFLESLNLPPIEWIDGIEG